MEILKIRSAVSLKMLQNACGEKKQTVLLPLACKGYNGEDRHFYMSIRLENVKPLGEDGSSFFKGQTVPTNAKEAPIPVDGFVCTKSKSDDYGRLIIYDD